MKALFLRFLTIGTLFLLGALVVSLTGISYLSLPLWYSAVLVWTLTLGFRSSLAVNIPFLLVADVLWDSSIGAVFLFGFLLSTATTYLAARIETRSQGLQNFLYSMLIGVFSLFVIAVSFYFPDFVFTFSSLGILFKIFLILLIFSALIFLPLSTYINWVEKLLDNSYREQIKKIR